MLKQGKFSQILSNESAESGCICSIRKADEPFPFSPQKEDRLFKPDFLLIRNFPTDLHNINYRVRFL